MRIYVVYASIDKGRMYLHQAVVCEDIGTTDLKENLRHLFTENELHISMVDRVSVFQVRVIGLSPRWELEDVTEEALWAMRDLRKEAEAE